MNTWVRVGLMAALVAVLFAFAGASGVAVVLGAAGVVLLVVGLAVGGWRTRTTN
jgi:uncharacterized membrane protein YqjE